MTFLLLVVLDDLLRASPLNIKLDIDPFVEPDKGIVNDADLEPVLANATIIPHLKLGHVALDSFYALNLHNLSCYLVSDNHIQAVLL